MATLRQGVTNVDDVKSGDEQVEKIMQGDELVWSAAKAVFFTDTQHIWGDHVVEPASKLLTLSFWVYLRRTNVKEIFVSLKTVGNDSVTNGAFRMELTASGFIFFEGFAPGNSSRRFAWLTNTTPELNQWNHMIISIDMANENGTKFFLNDIEQNASTPGTFLNEAIGMGARTYIFTGWVDGSVLGDLSEMYINTQEYLDLSIEANRRKFISAAGTPVDLGLDGSTPTGNQPFVYLSGKTEFFNAGGNLGYSGNIPLRQGPVTHTLNSPVKLNDYTAKGIFLAGGNYLEKLDGLTTVSDGQAGTVSFWIKTTNRSQGNGLSLYPIGGVGGPRLMVRMDFPAKGVIEAIGREKDTATAINAFYNETGNTVDDDVWHHVLMSFDLTSLTIHLYIDDVSDNIEREVPHNFLVEMTGEVQVNGNSGLNAVSSYSEMYFNDVYIDISIESNRRKFIDSYKKPVFLGSQGELPTGSQPPLFLTGTAGTWNAGINAGSGGNLTMIGSATNVAGP